MSKASQLFNELSYNTRLIAGIAGNELLINQIRIDQEKAKNAYRKFMGETNDQIGNLERSIKSDYLMLKSKLATSAPLTEKKGN